MLIAPCYSHCIIRASPLYYQVPSNYQEVPSIYATVLHVSYYAYLYDENMSGQQYKHHTEYHSGLVDKLSRQRANRGA